MTPRQHFLSYVRQEPGARPVVSPFLSHGDVVTNTLGYLNLPAGDDPIANEIRQNLIAFVRTAREYGSHV